MIKALFFLILITFSSTATAAEPLKQQLLERMFAAMGMEATVDRETYAACEAALSVSEVKQVIAFFETPAGKHLSGAMRASYAVNFDKAVEAEAQKRTFSDVLTLATAVTMYGMDHEAYPPALTLDELGKQLQPDYIRAMRRTDGWGHEFLYLTDTESYRIVSAGPDGRFGKGSTILDAEGEFGDDVIFEDGEFLQPEAAREWIESIRAE